MRKHFDITLRIPSKSGRFAFEAMHFEGFAVDTTESLKSPVNRVRVLHTGVFADGTYAVFSEGPLSRENARRWYAEAIRDGGKRV